MTTTSEQYQTPKVFKAAKKAIPTDKEKLSLDFESEAIETNNDARSDHGGKAPCRLQGGSD